MYKKDNLSNHLDCNSLTILTNEELINLDGGDVSQAVTGLLEWCGRTGGRIANAWDYYKSAMIAKASKEHHIL